MYLGSTSDLQQLPMVNIDHLYLPFYNDDGSDAYSATNPVEEETEAIARELDENIETFRRNKRKKLELLAMRRRMEEREEAQERRETKSPTEILLEEMEGDDEDEYPVMFR